MEVVKQCEHVSHQVELMSCNLAHHACNAVGHARRSNGRMAGEAHFKLLKADLPVAIRVAHVHHS